MTPIKTNAISMMLGLITVSAVAGPIYASVPNASGSTLAISKSLQILTTALINAKASRYTQDFGTEHFISRSSYDGNANRTNSVTIYEEHGLQHFLGRDSYQTATQYWVRNGSTWTVHNQPVKPEGQNNAHPLTAAYINRYFYTFKVARLDPNDITFTLVPNVPYDTQFLNFIRSSLMPGTPGEPEGSVWDLSIQLRMHFDGKTWWPTHDTINYTFNDVYYLGTSGFVNIIHSYDDYFHEPQAVRLPSDAPRS